jgi:hypothetical protein
MTSFFDKSFFQKLLIAVFSNTIVLAIAVVIGLYVGDKIDKMVALSDSIGNTLERVETTVNTVVGINPEVLNEKATAMKDGVTKVGEGFGDGGAETVNRIGEAWNNFKKDKE